MIARRKTILGIEERPSDEKARVVRHREEGATAEASRNSEEARAGAEPINSEDRVPTGAAVTGTHNAAETREPATTAAKLREARSRAMHLTRQ